MLYKFLNVMKIHEYQAKAILKSAGGPVPESRVASTVEEAVQAFKDLGSIKVIIKAQIHAGGRGKGGGVKLASSEAEVKEVAGQILGMTLVTHQTGPEGKLVKKIMIEEAVDVKKEFYAAITLDRENACPVMMVSREGGMEIEEVAEKNPEAIIKLNLHPLYGISPYQARYLAFKLGLMEDDPSGGAVSQAAKVFTALARLFLKKDASMVEVNPLALLGDGRVVIADAKVTFDDSALPRMPDIEELRDEDEEDPAENAARKADLSYVKLDGNIGCMVNGAGLAMGTMDIVKSYGAEPANFLDVGGTAKSERVKQALELILSDPNVKAIFVNIFGGIVRCDEVAKGIVLAKNELGISLPITIRLTGTNQEEGIKVLEDAGFEVGASMNDGAEKVTASIK